MKGKQERKESKKDTIKPRKGREETRKEEARKGEERCERKKTY